MTCAPSEVRKLHSQFKKNANKRGISFHLTMSSIDALWERCGGCCEVSGIEFDLSDAHRGQRRPFFPSIDRIKSEAGYTEKNVRLVCVAVNLGMNTWGEDIFKRIGRAIYLKETYDNNRTVTFVRQEAYDGYVSESGSAMLGLSVAKLKEDRLKGTAPRFVEARLRGKVCRFYDFDCLIRWATERGMSVTSDQKQIESEISRAKKQLQEAYCDVV